MERTVYVVAWISNTGSGSVWFDTPEAANLRFVEEASHVMYRIKERWTAFRFDFQTEAAWRNDITRDIAESFINLCANAERRLGPITLS